MKIDENEAQEKKKGFLRAPAKAAMVVLQLLAVGVLVFCMGVFLLFMQNGGELSNLKNPGTYTDTYQCGSTVEPAASEVDHIQRARFLNWRAYLIRNRSWMSRSWLLYCMREMLQPGMT